MSVNTLDFNQAANLLNYIVAYAKGQTPASTPSTTEAEFVSVGREGLLTGYDKLATAISVVLSSTIFNARPYSRKFADLYVDTQKYGAITRKLAVIDREFEDDQRFDLTDGASVDPWEVKKPQVLQLNFYGANEFQDHITIYTTQLDQAFKSSVEFSEFISMIMTNMSDRIEQAHEELARGALANLIGGIDAIANANQNRHLLTEYNAATGLSLTATTVMQPANFPGFITWAAGVIADVSNKLTCRSTIYHQNITGKVLAKHTPKDDQRFYMASDFLEAMKAQVASGLYHNEPLQLNAEAVEYWTDLADPRTVKCAGLAYLKNDGTIQSASGVTTVDNVLGLICDRDAVGYTTINSQVLSTPINAAGGYTNMYWHFTDKYFNAFEENAVVFYLD